VGGDEVSASEARKRLERMRHKQQAEAARRQMDQVWAGACTGVWE
jgi:hypothetical protein